MGRVVKNPRVSDERYVVEAPAFPVTTPAASEDGYVEYDGYASFDMAPPLASEPELPETPPVDWEALHAEAAALIDEASRDAEVLLTDARERARTILEEAGRQAHEILANARTEGFSAGRIEGNDRAGQEMSDMLASMRQLVEMARVERHKIVASAEPEIVRLAMGIAERVLHQQIAIDPNVVAEMTKAAIARLVDRESVTVRVNPADLERMREYREELLSLGDVQTMRVIEDQRVDRGGVVVETESGTIDAKITTQLKEARRVLHIDDDVIVTPVSDSMGSVVLQPAS